MKSIFLHVSTCLALFIYVMKNCLRKSKSMSNNWSSATAHSHSSSNGAWCAWPQVSKSWVWIASSTDSNCRKLLTVMLVTFQHFICSVYHSIVNSQISQSEFCSIFRKKFRLCGNFLLNVARTFTINFEEYHSRNLISATSFAPKSRPSPITDTVRCIVSKNFSTSIENCWSCLPFFSELWRYTEIVNSSIKNIT